MPICIIYGVEIFNEFEFNNLGAAFARLYRRVVKATAIPASPSEKRNSKELWTPLPPSQFKVLSQSVLQAALLKLG